MSFGHFCNLDKNWKHPIKFLRSPRWHCMPGDSATRFKAPPSPLRSRENLSMSCDLWRTWFVKTMKVMGSTLYDYSGDSVRYHKQSYSLVYSRCSIKICWATECHPTRKPNRVLKALKTPSHCRGPYSGSASAGALLKKKTTKKKQTSAYWLQQWFLHILFKNYIILNKDKC